MKKPEKNRKKRLSALKRGSKRGVRAKRNQEFKLESRSKKEAETSLLKFKQEQYLNKLLASRKK